ncbi:Mitochondrial copper homeostasis protein [Steccherinum ochraceum]|uniref:Mitochondrial copper homeostasis protein n=1 Tax=Steccherinum ochraceum TaxID=92696 RepID=A0A4R0R5X5_9APHY|nr:Mitochondrial copper homeostasis protein [Steccherinum ochraceum]
MSSAAQRKEEDIPHPLDNVKPENYHDQFKGRHVSSKYINPCEAAAKASMDCMNRHDYVRDKCLDYFQAYRDCKKTWMDERKADRRAGKTTA